MSTKITYAILIAAGIFSAGCKNLVWQEAENFTEAEKGVEQVVGPREPASGGSALNGSAIDVKGRKVKYGQSLKRSIPRAKIIFRFARLHWKAGMQPAEFTCDINNAGRTFTVNPVFGDTRGWGSNNSNEWDLCELKVGDLKKGKLEVILTVSSELGDVTLDGFFIAPEEINITKSELNNLSRIKINNDGYIGINLNYSAIEQNDFSGFDIVLRNFGRKRWTVSAGLVDENKKEVIPFQKAQTIKVPDSLKINIRPDAVRKLEDGNYTVVVNFNDNKDKLTYPFTVLGNIIVQAEKKNTEYKDFVAGYEKNYSPAWNTVTDDIKYASDYIDNTIIYLRSKRGSVQESDRKRALSYFEKARNRSAQTFVADIRSIIAQTDETINRVKNNSDPYANRSGDFRRAFYSRATGKLEPYRVYVPTSYEKKDRVPVMLVLHGGGGDENYYPDMSDGAIPGIMEKEGMIMVSPKATSWYTGDGAKDMVQLVELVCKEYPKADKSKLYCTGVSMGGFGTYTLATEYPGLFAAAICVSGSSRNFDKIKNLKNTPCLIIHGGSDSVVPVENAKSTAEKLKELGYTYELKIFPDYGHDYHAEEYMNLSLDFIKKHGK